MCRRGQFFLVLEEKKEDFGFAWPNSEPFEFDAAGAAPAWSWDKEPSGVAWPAAEFHFDAWPSDASQASPQLPAAAPAPSMAVAPSMPSLPSPLLSLEMKVSGSDLEELQRDEDRFKQRFVRAAARAAGVPESRIRVRSIRAA